MKRRDFLKASGSLVVAVGCLADETAETSSKITLEEEYSNLINGAYADPMTIDGPTNLRVWVQSGGSYLFRIARISLDDSQLLREPAVFEGYSATNVSTDPLRGLWNAYATFSTTGWSDGLYAVDVRRGAPLPPINTTVASAIFIVRRGIASSRILYKLPTNTWNAYLRMPWKALGAQGHSFEERSFYGAHYADASTIAYHRPGLGLNGDLVFNGQIPYAESPGSQGAHCLFEGHKDCLPFLIEHFETLSLCTDLDLHAATAPEMLRNYRLLICSGHDEYWTTAMRANVAAHINEGRNVAFLSGNNLYWHVDISSTPSTSPASTLHTISADKNIHQRETGGWPANAGNEANLTGMSTRFSGGWLPETDRPFQFGPSLEYAWIRKGEPQLNAPGLIGYEFDNRNTLSGPIADIVVAATAGPITAFDGANYDWETPNQPRATDLEASLSYFQPFGSVVNVGTTEWIRHTNHAGVGQTTKNIVRTLSSDRRFVSIGPFSRSSGFDIVYSNPIELSGELETSRAISFWALNANQASPAIERGKWISMRQTVSGYEAKAFGRNAAGASRLYFQNGSGQISVWNVQMTTSNAIDLRPLVDSGALCFSTTAQLVGAGRISTSAELDLVLTTSTTVVLQKMNGTLGSVKNGMGVSLNFPVVGAMFAAFGTVKFAGNHVPALAFTVGLNRLVISRITMSGLPIVVDTTISGFSPATRIVGFGDLNNDQKPELVVTHDQFVAGTSAPTQTGTVLNVSAASLTPLTMKTGFFHDS